MNFFLLICTLLGLDNCSTIALLNLEWKVRLVLLDSSFCATNNTFDVIKEILRERGRFTNRDVLQILIVANHRWNGRLALRVSQDLNHLLFWFPKADAAIGRAQIDSDDVLHSFHLLVLLHVYTFIVVIIEVLVIITFLLVAKHMRVILVAHLDH